ncbi:MAG: nitronate monooxygenase [Opitutales bacterium]|nr:nitronate monooxygenase [Opitutales bacterium]
MSHPLIIQGGMGVGVSGWKLASAVSREGQLGVVAGTALATVLIRRLQDGDPEGVCRKAMEAFPVKGLAEKILQRYFVPSGKPADKGYLRHPLPDANPKSSFQELTVVGNFVEVFLAKAGHGGKVGLNLLEKIQIPTLASLYGAMLAGVDYILMGAGIPRSIPGVLDDLTQGKKVSLPLDVDGASRDESISLSFDPEDYPLSEPMTLKRPSFLAIVSSHVLAQTLVKKSNGRVDGLIVEGASAGGHNAPPRVRGAFSETGEPLYGPRDEVDLAKIRDLNLPFWLAGSYGQPGKLKEALGLGAAGVQVGTPFAFCEESGIDPEIKAEVIAQSRAGTLKIYTDPSASPTGFPFKVISVEDSISEQSVYEARTRRCDLGYLRKPYRREDGSLGYRCPAEPVDQYVRKGGSAEEAIDRKCVCNGLMSTMGLSQVQPGNEKEPTMVTGGNDAKLLPTFLAGEDRTGFSAKEVIYALLKDLPSEGQMAGRTREAAAK